MSRPIQTLDSSDPVIFDGNVAVCFIVLMNSYVNNAKVRNIAPGVLYTMIFQQDADGNHEFVWPGSCLNAAAIDTKPGAFTVQNFIGNTGGSLQANLPGTRRET